MLLIISKVCAEFHDGAGTPLFTIHADQLLKPIEAPESIRQDPLYDMLVQSRELEAVEKKEDLKKAENDPFGKSKEKKPEKTKPAGSTAPADEKPSDGNTAGNKVQP